MASLTYCIAHHLAFCRNSYLWKWFHCDSLTILDVKASITHLLFFSSVNCITKKETNRIIKAVDPRVALQKWIMENTWIDYTRKMNDMLNRVLSSPWNNFFFDQRKNSKRYRKWFIVSKTDKQTIGGLRYLTGICFH